jgi:formylglycine-generating enzyme required for sulfatase activity
VTGGARGDRPTRALVPSELLRGLATGTDEERADRGRDPRAADAGWRRGAAIAVLAVAGTGALATSGRVATGSGAIFGESAAISRVAGRANGSVEAQGDSAVKTRKFGTDALRGAVVAAALTAGATAQEAVQWRVEDGGNGHWYRLHPVVASWPVLRTASEQAGGHIVTLTSAEEWAWVKANFEIPYQTGRFVGAYQDRQSADFSEPGGGWRWVTGEPFRFQTSFMTPLDDFCGNQQIMIFMGCCNQVLDDIQDGVEPGCDSFLRQAIFEWSADCNSDGIVDFGQIRAGQLPDANANNVPDSCECGSFPDLPTCRCVGDIVADRIVNGADLGTLLSYWGPRTSGSFSIASDLNDNGTIDGADLGMLLSNWGECQPAAVIVPPWATLIEAAPDPAVVTDPALRTAIAATGLAWRVRDTGTGIEMLLVPPGAFQMGCSPSMLFACSDSEFPVRQVTLTKPFYLARHELTQRDWRAVMGSNPSYFVGFPDSDSRPVEQVSWNDSVQFSALIGMRLPTEAEWEYACRAGTTTAFFNGSNDDSTLGDIAWIGSNDGDQIRPVGRKAANRLGFFDMLGNVWEWVADFKGEYPSTPETDPTGPVFGIERVLRGHSCFDGSYNNARSSSRDWGEPSLKHAWTGFRVARNP